MKKETLYIDVEDDITSVVEKITTAKEKIVAIVPPKRSNLLASVVNLKLINKTAQDTNKRVVLITTDKTLVTVAGGIGMYVAANLQSAPAIPAVAPPPEDMPSEVIDEAAGEGTPDKSFKLKETSKSSKSAVSKEDLPKKLDLEDSSVAAVGKDTAKTEDKPPKDRRIPNFKKFKKKFIIIALALLLLIGVGVWAVYFAPKAQVALEGQTNRIATNTEFTTDTGVEEADFEEGILPAERQELRRELSETAAATGEKNIGEQASGNVELKNCSNNNSQPTIASGTTVTASGGRRFTTQEAVTLPVSVFTGGGDCVTSERTVKVSAVEPGDQYNLSPRSYTVSGFPSVRGQGSTMSGGTNEVVKVLSKEDVDSAQEAALTRLRDGAKEELMRKFDENIYAIEASLTENVTEVSPSTSVSEQVDSVSVKVSVIFSAFGVKKEILEDYLETIQSESLQENQAIFDTGLDNADIDRLASPSANRETYRLRTDAHAGPDVDYTQLQTELAGQSFGAAKSRLESIPGVTKAEIDLSPFWVFSMPRRAHQINIEIIVD